MSALQFLSTLPAILGFAGFVIYFLIRRNSRGDRVTLTIIEKLRAQGAERIPSDAEKLDAASLSKLIEGDVSLRNKISDQDFQLLRDALRQQFITSLIVYGACGLAFLAGAVLYVYLNPPARPVALSNFVIASVDPSAKGLAVDLDDISVRWDATGDPEDLKVSLQEMDTSRQTSAKLVRSSDATVIFSADEYRSVLPRRERGTQNRVRVIAQSQARAFHSPEFALRVGTKILAIRFADKREFRIAATIDNRLIDFYAFEARLIVWGSKPGQEPGPIGFGGRISGGQASFAFDPAVKFDWTSAKLVYLGPDDPRLVRTELLGF